MSRLQWLDEPLELGPVRLANRAVLCTAGVDLADPEGRLTDAGFDWLIEQARRGWGMVLLEFGRGVGPPRLEQCDPRRIESLVTATGSVPLGISVARSSWCEEIERLVEAGVAAVELEGLLAETKECAVGLRGPALPAEPTLPIDWFHLAPDDEMAEGMRGGSPMTPLVDRLEPGAIEPPVMVSGRVKDATVADHLVGHQGAALVGLGRGALADPDLIDRARRNESWMPCSGCMACRKPGDGPGCALTPTEYFAAGAGGSSWTIVGASVAALRVAIALHRCGHHVAVFRGGQPIGGAVRLRGRLPDQVESAEAAAYLRRRVRECGIEMVPDLPERIETDHVLVAMPGEPQVEVSLDPSPVDARAILEEGGGYGQTHAVWGDTLLAAETTALLQMKAIDVTLVCEPDRLAADTHPSWRTHWREWFTTHDVRIVPPDSYDATPDVQVIAPRTRRVSPVARAIRQAVPETIVLDDPYEPFSQRATLESAFSLVSGQFAYM